MSPKKEILDRAISKGAKIELTHDPVFAVKDADFINTDVWASMGVEGEEEVRLKAFSRYQVNDALIQHAKKRCKGDALSACP